MSPSIFSLTQNNPFRFLLSAEAKKKHHQSNYCCAANGELSTRRPQVTTYDYVIAFLLASKAQARLDKSILRKLPSSQAGQVKLIVNTDKHTLTHVTHHLNNVGSSSPSITHLFIHLYQDFLPQISRERDTHTHMSIRYEMLLIIRKTIDSYSQLSLGNKETCHSSCVTDLAWSYAISCASTQRDRFQFGT